MKPTLVPEVVEYSSIMAACVLLLSAHIMRRLSGRRK